MKYSALIVCSDARATELAIALSGAFAVYKRAFVKNSKTWVWYVHSRNNLDDPWDPIQPSDEDKLPASFDVLFFHTGDGDPSGIPASTRFGAEFAFSGAGLGTGVPPGGRARALPIRRRFEAGECPVKPRHTSELEDYLSGSTTDPPGFCGADRPFPAVVGIAVLCQAYFAAGIVNGEIAQDGRIAARLGWPLLPEQVRSRLSPHLRGWWNEVQESGWWLRSLGVGSGAPDKAGYDELLQQLVDDIDAIGPLKAASGLRRGDRIADLPADRIVDFLATQAKSKSIGELLRGGSVINPDLVARVFDEVLAILSEA